MIKHYLKISFRNLWKYKIQSIISILGLAIGFTCFSLSLFWIRYEYSFDNFHHNADRIYRVRMATVNDQDTTQKALLPHTSYKLAEYLKQNFPEIENASRISQRINTFPLDKKDYRMMEVDSAFCSIFDIPGEKIFLPLSSKNIPVTVTKDFAMSVFGKENVVGETFEKEGKKYEICYVINKWPDNSSIQFDVLVSLENEILNLSEQGWLGGGATTYVLIRENSGDMDLLNRKLANITIKGGVERGVEKLKLTADLVPLRKVNFLNIDNNTDRNVQINYVIIFSISGLLVFFCALFSYVSLLVSRIKAMEKEFIIRIANGSSLNQLFKLLSIEFIITLLLSFILGIFFIAFFLPDFVKISQIRIESIHIFKSIGIFSIIILSITFLVSYPFIWYFCKKTTGRIRLVNHRVKAKSVFSKISLLLQLIISIGFIFCSLVLYLQIYHLSNTDLGFERKNIAEIKIKNANKQLIDDYTKRIKQISTVTETINTCYPDFFKDPANIVFSIPNVDKDGNTLSENISIIVCDDHFFDFFKIKIIKGSIFSEKAPEGIVVNEYFVKKNQWDEPLNQKILGRDVIGVAQDIYYGTPTTPPVLLIFSNKDGLKKSMGIGLGDFRGLVYKYREGSRKQTEDAIRSMILKDNADAVISFSYFEDIYDSYLKSETSLMKLLGCMSIACIFISLFSVYSCVSLSCRQRRKEIAIRKVNGAQVYDILNIFIKENIVLLFIASLIAFPVSYKLMANWIENYTKQITIDWWVFALIFLIIGLILCVTIIVQVWKTANENPAEVIKSE